ncbi:recombinase family protein [Haloterrigena sp. SYSU A558-1]|uniref:Recombinase family protein n=1 Tax=Haloterrigena gelatinilytica TaxID=2741724 RepID=A0ABX2LNR9_9EURY|nr:recombinase family protein [Haloterrigena gelatinilytica]NUC74774.1 recombinase family protein [Haloterrigena gelatinilytica]
MGHTAIYARVSTDSQDSTRQLEECRAEINDDEPFEVYAETGSGADPDRPEINRLIDDIKSGDVDCVVVWEISRISRNLAFTAQFIELCVENEVELHSLNDIFPRIRADSDIMQEMVGKIAAWMMEFEREMIRERIKSGIRNARSQGKWLGRPPYGFTTDDDGYLIVESEEYLNMQTALEILETDDDMSISAAARHTGVPKSSLSRIYKDEERRKLYLFGEVDDSRIVDAVENDDDVTHDSELVELRKRIENLEETVERAVGE